MKRYWVVEMKKYKVKIIVLSNLNALAFEVKDIAAPSLKAAKFVAHLVYDTEKTRVESVCQNDT